MRSLVVVLAAALALPGTALAGDAAAAAALKARADASFNAGDFPTALLLLEQAYQADPQPGFFANQGLVLERLGDFARAAAAFDRYLASDPPPEKRAVIEAKLNHLRPEVVVSSEPAGADVHVDSAPVPLGRTPLKTRLLTGAHFVELRLEGHEVARSELRLEPGQPATVRLVLVPRAAPPPPPAADDRRATWGWVGVGTGAAALATSTVFYFLARSELDARDGATSEQAWDDHQSAAELRAGVHYGAAGVGAAALSLGLYLLLTHQ